MADVLSRDVLDEMADLLRTCMWECVGCLDSEQGMTAFKNVYMLLLFKSQDINDLYVKVKVGIIGSTVVDGI